MSLQVSFFRLCNQNSLGAACLNRFCGSLETMEINLFPGKSAFHNTACCLHCQRRIFMPSWDCWIQQQALRPLNIPHGVWSLWHCLKPLFIIYSFFCSRKVFRQPRLHLHPSQGHVALSVLLLGGWDLKTDLPFTPLLINLFNCCLLCSHYVPDSVLGMRETLVS